MSAGIPGRLEKGLAAVENGYAKLSDSFGILSRTSEALDEFNREIAM